MRYQAESAFPAIVAVTITHKGLPPPFERPQADTDLAAGTEQTRAPRFQEICHPSDQYNRGFEDMSNASLQRSRHLSWQGGGAPQQALAAEFTWTENGATQKSTTSR